MAFGGSPVFSDLKAEVQAWLDRDDPTTVAEIPTFCRYAHDEIVRELRIPAVMKTAPLSLAAERVALPSDFTAARTLNIADVLGVTLTAVSPAVRSTHAALWPAGRPTEYSIEAATMAVAPIPDTSYAATLIYDAAPLLMQADGDTNPVFARTPHLYLQGALAAGFLFNQFTSQAATWESQFRNTLAGLKRQGLADAFGGPLHMRPSMGFCP